jgi:glycosyltransferase involved in cell wall biosynthesis
MNNKTLIIIPAHNEERSLPGVIRSIETFSPGADILVVNDASVDGTSHVVRTLRTKAKVTVIDLPYNLGIGGAMQTGFAFAREGGYSIALQIDGDGQHPAKYIRDLKGGIEKDRADMVVGSRFLKAIGFKGFFLRRIGIRYFSFLIAMLTGRRIFDVTSGFRAFGKKAIRFFSEYYPHDYPEVESLVVLKKLNLSVMELPVTMKRRRHGMSTINWLDGIYYMIRVSLGTVISALRTYTDLKGGRKCSRSKSLFRR